MSKDKTQSDKFIDAAREVDASEDADQFKDRLRTLVKAPPPKSVQARKPTDHDSDCAIHNGPALEAGPCDCGMSKSQK